jgi:hypothetical protein
MTVYNNTWSNSTRAFSFFLASPASSPCLSSGLHVSLLLHPGPPCATNFWVPNPAAANEGFWLHYLLSIFWTVQVRE